MHEILRGFGQWSNGCRKTALAVLIDRANSMPFLLLENGYEISLLLGWEGLLPSIPDWEDLPAGTLGGFSFCNKLFNQRQYRLNS